LASKHQAALTRLALIPTFMSRNPSVGQADTGGDLCYTIPLETSTITDRDRAMAQVCMDCPVCSYARKNQKGVAFWFVKKIEGSACPFCKAYERVYGRKAHEPDPEVL
jgi:hypothetical protein